MSYIIDGMTITEAQAERLAEQVAERKRRPQPVVGQVYRHRETTDAEPHTVGWVLWRYEGAQQWSRKESSGASWRPYNDHDFCAREVTSGRFVPYTPPIITNATHAGRRVRYADPEFTARVVSSSVAKRLHDEYLSIGTVVVVKDDGQSTWAPSHSWTLLD